jgi:uncharacterized protein
MIIRQRYLNRITPFIDKPVIKVITGIRRCGKSTFLKMIIEQLTNKGVESNNILLINKDSLEFDWMEDYRQLVDYVNDRFVNISGKKYLFIDEIQEITGWEKAASGFLADETADLYITGSNSHLLSSELATYISGRYIEFKIYTLTFSEFLEFRNVTAPLKYESEFALFMKYGGFPGIHRMEYDDEVVEQYVSSIYNTIILKDVVSRNNLRDIHLLERISQFVADNCGNITSSKRIADFLKSQKIKGSVDTVQSYIEMLVSALLFHKVIRFDMKGKRLLEMYEKYYAGDVGLKHSLLGYKFSDISGHLENIVYLELLSRGYKVNIGKIGEQEIDFIATRRDKKIYIQVAYLLADEKTIEREFGALGKIEDNFPKYVLSMDKFNDSTQNGIKWLNIIDFLLSKDI